ncbi:Uncharacterised protein [Vibrio cholerae]|nr:Uncharacterised protein [Vibrio cholerae]
MSFDVFAGNTTTHTRTFNLVCFQVMFSKQATNRRA